MIRFVPRCACVCALLALAALSGCEDVIAELGKQQADGKSNATASMSPRSDGTIRIATFNIQVFGTSKLEKSNVVNVLAQVVRQFDVVAIQEIRSKDDSVLSQFVAKVNADGGRYDFVVGPRLGRTSSKEQYAYIYDTQRIELDADGVWTVPDPDDRLHREPFVARFRTHGQDSSRAFTCTLINIHTDPDETDAELDALDDVFRAVQRSSPPEDDVILLGDLNVDDRHLGQLGRVANAGWVITGQATNTRGNKSYDNIVFDRRATVEYTGSFGVLDLQQEFGLSLEEALEVSDHRPVWAAFNATEGAVGELAGDGGTLR